MVIFSDKMHKLLYFFFEYEFAYRLLVELEVGSANGRPDSFQNRRKLISNRTTTTKMKLIETLTDGWKPFSSAMYVTLINCPSGAVYE